MGVGVMRFNAPSETGGAVSPDVQVIAAYWRDAGCGGVVRASERLRMLQRYSSTIGGIKVVCCVSS